METKIAAAITPERFASGMTFIEYLDYIASPENLGREGNEGAPRVDRSPQLRAWFRAMKLQDHQVEALRWLAGQAEGPAKVLAIVEEWSSDCRRDLPMLARMAEAANLELRIFNRDGSRFSRTHRPSPAESPNADLMEQFLNQKRDRTWQSIP